MDEQTKGLTQSQSALLPSGRAVLWQHLLLRCTREKEPVEGNLRRLGRGTVVELFVFAIRRWTCGGSTFELAARKRQTLQVRL